MPALPLLGAAATAVVLVGATALGVRALPPGRPPVPVRQGPAVPAEGDVTATVPLVATSVDDGLPRVLAPGPYRLDLPVWEAPDGPAARVEGAVRGAAGSCRPVPLVPGGVVRLRCALVVRPGRGDVVLSVRSRSQVVGRFAHVTAG
ncbi:MAG: hypothetical protein ACXVWU_01895 [Nocardioides sp.]